ncbi:NAD-dependent epimerase/dehydratase family protein [Lacticaseibacillus paracasei]|uniref:NAD-dependent epimerase/dehydratase family protein n=1 Tax=Lacticaseibacillus paracasei TaxID=1597 RepID=UPI0021A52706|nr:NAD-dependent epimerase/dehydratase family protein [Lacticaseibacillus paracasei]MCT4384168.1 NAD-dependent epimerase/dehydratase family protein [Lacticaseibacillus paracasei]
MQEYSLYQSDVQTVVSTDLPWIKLANKKILITGASGLIGSFLVDVLMQKNHEAGLDLHVYAVGRSEAHAKAKFQVYWDDPLFTFVSHNVNSPLTELSLGTVDYVLHLASNTHPRAYATDPIGTITANIIGTQNLLEFALAHDATRFVFASSNEIYGENRGDVELFDEDYCGYINSNTLRAGYPESKRAGEALCQAYKTQRGLDVVIPRLTRTYGPTMANSDSKAIAQFLKNGLSKQDIVLKSKGTQNYSFTYVADAVSGLLAVLLLGVSGEAYNIADQQSNITLLDFAQLIANFSGTKVVFNLPDATEKAGFSRATKALLNPAKLQALGWHAVFDIKTGIAHTIDILSK